MSGTVRLLLVAPDAHAVAADLAATPGVPPLAVTAVGSPLAARAYVSGTAFDAVAVSDAAAVAGLSALRDVLGGEYPVTDFTDVPGLATWLRDTFGSPSGETAPGAEAPPASPEITAEALRALRADLARIAHDLGSPLAVVSGNAQLGLELARAFGADAQLAEAFEQIDEAAVEMAVRLRHLGALRLRLDDLLDISETGPTGD